MKKTIIPLWSFNAVADLWLSIRAFWEHDASEGCGWLMACLAATVIILNQAYINSIEAEA